MVSEEVSEKGLSQATTRYRYLDLLPLKYLGCLPEQKNICLVCSPKPDPKSFHEIHSRAKFEVAKPMGVGGYGFEAASHPGRNSDEPSADMANTSS